MHRSVDKQIDDGRELTSYYKIGLIDFKPILNLDF